MTIKAPSYRAPAIGGGMGNLCCDIITYKFTGEEAAADPILLRKNLSSRNTYVEARILGDGTLTALTAADLGVINREGGADAVDALAADAVLTEVDQDLLPGPYAPGFQHDLVLTPTVLADAANEVDKEITIILMFVATS